MLEMQHGQRRQHQIHQQSHQRHQQPPVRRRMRRPIQSSNHHRRMLVVGLQEMVGSGLRGYSQVSGRGGMRHGDGDTWMKECATSELKEHGPPLLPPPFHRMMTKMVDGRRNPSPRGVGQAVIRRKVPGLELRVRQSHRPSGDERKMWMQLE